MAETGAAPPFDENSPASRGFVQAQFAVLNGKIDGSVKGLNEKLDASVRRLDAKIDSSVQRLDSKIDSSAERLDRKIDDRFNRLAVEIVNLRAGLDEVKQTMATKDDIRQVLSTINAFAGKYQSCTDAMTLHGHRITEMTMSLQDHEQRLGRLEGSRPAP